MSGIANWQAQIRIDIEDLKKRIKVAEGEINNFTNEDRKVKLDIDTKTLESAIQKLKCLTLLVKEQVILNSLRIYRKNYQILYQKYRA